jgi:hypothetical protein
MTLRDKSMIQHTHKQSRQLIVCTHNCSIKTHYTQPTHRHISKQISTNIHKHRVEIHQSKLTCKKTLTQPLALQSIPSQQIRIPTNEHDTHRTTKMVKPYNVPTALQIINSKYNSPSLSTNLGPNAEGKTTMSLRIPKYPAHLAHRWPLTRDRKKLPCNPSKTKPTQSIQCPHIPIVKHNQKIHLPSRDSSDECIQNINKCKTHVHSQVSSKQKRRHHSGKNTANCQDPAAANNANGQSYKTPARQDTLTYLYFIFQIAKLYIKNLTMKIERCLKICIFT